MVNAGDISIENGNGNIRKSAEEIDEQRRKTLAYEYLCHLEEAKKWMEACLRESLPPTIEMEENLRNGVYLAKLAHFMAFDALPLNKIYDAEQRKYKAAGLQFRHTDNINHFLRCLEHVQLPLIFQPETTDIYNKKNMPRVIYCIHALSTHLFKLGKAPLMQDLYGKVNFSEEDIDSVSKELQKYGIQMPAFQKIGGLLTNSITTDTATLHAAVFAVNQAVTDNDNDKVLRTLQNKELQLSNVKSAYIEKYTIALLDAKIAKVEMALNKSLNDSYVADAYDELLTQAEIQGHINYVNASCALKSIISSIRVANDTGENVELIIALKTSALLFKNIVIENVEDYKKELLALEEIAWDDTYPLENIQYWTDTFQNAIDKGNKNAQLIKKRNETVRCLNIALESADREKFYEILQTPYPEISEYIDEFAIPLYYQEMKEDRIQFQADITYDDITVSFNVLSVIAAVTKAVDIGNPDLVYEKLLKPDARLTGLDEFNKVRYTEALKTIRQKKLETSQECTLLTYSDIQECIDLVNEESDDDFEVIKILQQINRVVAADDCKNMMKVLEVITEKANIPIFVYDAPLYLKLFKKRLGEKKFDGSELWLDDIETIVKTAKSEIEKIKEIVVFLCDINTYVENDDMMQTFSCIKMVDMAKEFNKFTEGCQKKCFLLLRQLQKQKREKYSCPYISYVTNKGNKIYIDLKCKRYAWDCPPDFKKSCYITVDDVNEIIMSIMAEQHKKHHTIKNNVYNEKSFIRFQACMRGYLLRKKITDRHFYFNDNLEKIITIQAWWRCIRQRKQYCKLMDKRNRQNKIFHQNKYLHIKTDKINDAGDKLSRYKKNEDKIVKIQALWRGRASRKAFHSLLNSNKPSFPVVRYFSAVLGFSAEDYDKDLELQKLKHEVVQCIRHNQNLSEQLNNMYVKIGLLIQNRIALQDVVAYGKNLDTLAKEKNTNKDQNISYDVATTAHKGLKSLTKEGRKMLESYQHLFYALQTNPQYLSKLLYLPPSNKSNKLFLKNIILTLFNFGSNTREDYLLLKLFGCALREDIRCNCHQPSDVLTGKPLVREMVVNYAKQFNDQSSLKQILGPLIEKVLEEKDLCMETNPVDIYKLWRNQLETESGQSLNMPHTVPQEEALKYIPVQELLMKAINQLKRISLEFLDRITQSRDLIPYGMLYVSKVLYNSLTEKFSQTPEKDILKAVGNLIYYHFINAAIVAPDTFDIVTLTVNRSLSSCQRKNLASIAKVLQFSTSKKGFGEEAPHLECLNQFIIVCHEKFKNFFRYCCQVEDLEEHFDIHEYTEATLIQNPEICISLQEICEMHTLMLTYQDQIAPDPSDPLHDLLDDLGSAPTVASLLGISDVVYQTNLTRYSKQEVCLVLTNKFQIPRNDDTNLNNLFVKAKELLVSIISFLKKSTLIESLETTSSPMCMKLFDYSSVSPTLNVIRESSSINDCKMQLRAYLKRLELEGWVTYADGYQAIVTSIAKDICNKSKYRVVRDKELQTLRATRERLDKKTKYYQEQVLFYNEYIKRCLQNLHGKSSLCAYQVMHKDTYKLSKLRSKMTVKYSAWKLQEKGVLMDANQMLSPTEMKNAIFEITPTEHSGIFVVRCKFMGVELEKLEINIQELLELQYEGRSCMNMFGKAKVNVNLLLHLLNRKFYGKKT